MTLFYITKYALSEGILALECDEISDSMIQGNRRSHEYYHGEGRDWHRTKEGAVKKANEMRSRKIASLRIQIATLEDMTFTTDEGRAP